MIQDIVPFHQAPAIYDRLRDQPGDLLGTVFDWTAEIAGIDASAAL